MARKTSRPRSSRRAARLEFAALEIVGALVTPAIVARIAAFGASDQTEESYGIPPGLKVRDEIARYFRIAEALWARFEAAKGTTAAASERFVLDFLVQCFGFTTIKSQQTIHKSEREFPVRHAALNGRVPIVIAPVPSESAHRSGVDESLPQFGDGSRRRSATLLLQEFLNAEEASAWGIATDGLTLRLMRDNVSLTRPAWIEADLSKIFTEGLFPDFSALWLLIHQSRFGQPHAVPMDCSLEHWRDAGRIEGVAARDKLRLGVEASLIELGQGFIENPSNTQLRQALTDGSLTRQAYFEELLRLIYRLIFLFAAEDRELLHVPAAQEAVTKAYAAGYSLSRLRERCMRRTAWDRHGDAWEGLKATFSSLGRGEPRLGLPALGGLFADGLLSTLTECKLENRRLLAAVWRLAWMRPDGHPLTRVNWRDMETEELGSVYESLLELTPIASADTRNFTFAEGDETRGNARRISGSYYTPDSLVQALLDETLNPLIEETIAGKDDAAAIEALLNLRIIDPACGSGHFLLAAARRLASQIAGLSNPGTPSQADYRHWLREVARRSLFGVDRNPMAIELAKVALWIETVEPGKPLSFLDAHLRCGDALLGIYHLSALQIGIPDDAYKPLTGDDKKSVSAWKARNKSEREARKQGELSFFEPPKELLESARALEALAEDDLSAVQKKAEAYRRFFAGPERHRMEVACDLYIAAFLLPKNEPPVRTVGGPGAFIPTSRDIWDKLEGQRPLGLIEANSVAVAKEARAFHWPLEFPQVFFPGAGRKPGFDLALGNPPWEVNQLGEEEYFAARAPAIADMSGKARKDAIKELEITDPRLWIAYQTDKRNFDASSQFFRESDRFRLTAIGKVNTYSLFAELFANVARRAGLLVPKGIATDATTANFFASLVNSGRLDSLYCFENEAFIFRGVHHSFQFAILAIRPPSTAPMRFMQFLRHLHQMYDQERRYFLSTSDIASINPNTRTAPLFRSKADAELTRQIYARVPVLVDESKGRDGNPWGIEFRQGLFNMTSDSDLFRTAHQLQSAGFTRAGRNWVNPKKDRYVPLYEAKMFDQFNHRFSDYSGRDDDRGHRVLPELTAVELSDPSRDPLPYYWVPASEVASQISDRRYLMGYGEATTASTSRTLVMACFPADGVGHKTILVTLNQPSQFDAVFLAIANSLTLDFIVRTKVSYLTLGQYVFKQLPLLSPSSITGGSLDFIVPRVLELTYTSHSMKPFSEDLGYSGSAPFSWNEDRRAILSAELDAKIAELYGLTRDQLRYILDPADVRGPDYPSETFRVLKEREMREHGEYRTGRLVLQAFDKLTAGTLSTNVVQLDARKTEIRRGLQTAPDRPDGAWARPRKDQRGEVGAMFLALLKAMDAPLPSRKVRLAAILALEPRLLQSHLTKAQSAEWRRLIGDEANPLPAGTVQFVPPTDQNWGAVVRGLRTRGILLDDSNTGNWAPGQGLEKTDTAGWPDGRARFVLDVLRSAGDQTVTGLLPAEVKRWLDAEAA